MAYFLSLLGLIQKRFKYIFILSLKLMKAQMQNSENKNSSNCHDIIINTKFLNVLLLSQNLIVHMGHM